MVIALQTGGEWLDYVGKYGIQTVLLFLFLLGFWKKGIPFIVAQNKELIDAYRQMVTEARDARREDQATFLGELKEERTMRERHTEAIQQMVKAIENLRQEIKEK